MRTHLPIFALAVVALVATAMPAAHAALPFVRVQGDKFVDDTGAQVNLRGVNLGNWLSLETWMFGLDESIVRDQRTVFDILEQRFGAEEAERLLDIHRAGWITQRDFDQIAALGFNSVRIPLWYGLMEREDEPFMLREDAWEWTDRALEMAEQAGIYVLFDMHGVQGGQSLDQPSGDVNANDIWNSPQDRERLAWLWQHFARQYKNNPHFLGYDVINEPYGDFNTDHRQNLIEIGDRIHSVVREIDPDRPILIPGSIEGIDFYGDPAARGWTGIGFTEHFYPGIFDGNERSLGTHARFWNGEAASKRAFVESVNAPYVIGEFNPIWNSAGAPGLAGAYFEESAQRGWGCYVWCYKLMSGNGGVGPNNWPIVTNAQPWSLGDLTTVSKSTLEARLTELAPMPLALDQQLADVLTGAAPSATLPESPELPTVLPTDTLPGWAPLVVGADITPGSEADSANAGTMHAPGRDIFGNRDEFGFLTQVANGNFGASVTIDRFETFRKFPKAGLMARASLAPDAPHLHFAVFQTTADAEWWEPANPVNPYPLLTGSQGSAQPAG